MDFEEIKAMFAWYIEKHPDVLTLGGDYIVQNEDAQKDAVQLVCDIFDNWE